MTNSTDTHPYRYYVSYFAGDAPGGRWKFGWAVVSFPTPIDSEEHIHAAIRGIKKITPDVRDNKLIILSWQPLGVRKDQP